VRPGFSGDRWASNAHRAKGLNQSQKYGFSSANQTQFNGHLKSSANPQRPDELALGDGNVLSYEKADFFKKNSGNLVHGSTMAKYNSKKRNLLLDLGGIKDEQETFHIKQMGKEDSMRRYEMDGAEGLLWSNDMIDPMLGPDSFGSGLVKGLHMTSYTDVITGKELLYKRRGIPKRGTGNAFRNFREKNF
jgi:hypothetical protein